MSAHGGVLSVEPSASARKCRTFHLRIDRARSACANNVRTQWCAGARATTNFHPYIWWYVVLLLVVRGAGV